MNVSLSQDINVVLYLTTSFTLLPFLDRRRYTVEPDALLDQVRILSHLPVSIIFQCRWSAALKPSIPTYPPILIAVFATCLLINLHLCND